MRGVCPDKHLRILYFNARSLYPKLDELRALCDMEKPDIVSITETWLYEDICESESYIIGTSVLGVTGIDMVVGLPCSYLKNWNSK